MRTFTTEEALVTAYWRKLTSSVRAAYKMKSGGAPPQSKTQATSVRRRPRPRFGLRQRFAA